MADSYEINKYKQTQRHSSIISEASIALQNILNEDFRGDKYCTKVLLAVIGGLCHVLIGAVIITNVLFSIQTEDPHSATFAIGVSLSFNLLVISLNAGSPLTYTLVHFV